MMRTTFASDPTACRSSRVAAAPKDIAGTAETSQGRTLMGQPPWSFVAVDDIVGFSCGMLRSSRLREPVSAYMSDIVRLLIYGWVQTATPILVVMRILGKKKVLEAFHRNRLRWK